MSGNVRRDRRVARTRASLIAAFNHIFLTGRGGAIRVDELAAEAAVGRSTLYEHFSGADGLHLEALKRPLACLADAAAGRGDRAALERLLVHFWENRQRGRETFGGRLAERVARLLAELVEERLGDAPLCLPRRLAARMLADAALAPLLPWLRGEAPASPAQLARAICRAGVSLRAALAIDQVQSAR